MSTLKVSNIQDISNNAAMSISGGVVTFANTPVGTGVIAVASDAEVRTGTLTNKAVTPANIKATQIGFGQTMQDLGGSRSFATTYTNSTGRAILVLVRAYYASGAMQIDHKIDNIQGNIQGVLTGWWCSLSFIVPSGSTYYVAASTHTAKGWCEVR